MISDVQQYQIHSGDREAFKALFAEYGKGAYLDAIQSLDSEAAARSVVKQAFFRLQNELIAAPGPIDIENRLHAIVNEEVVRAKAGATGAQTSDQTWDQVQPEQPAEPVQCSGPAEQEFSAPQECGEPAGRVCPAPQAHGPQPLLPHRRERRAGWICLVVLVVLLSLVLAWLVAGILMDLAIIPYVPLGYAWFNEHVYPFFWAL